jgi:sugar (pentulose or hexulose) kinase
MSEADPASIAGIGVDGVGWTLIPVDRAGNPLHPAMIWLDRAQNRRRPGSNRWMPNAWWI